MEDVSLPVPDFQSLMLPTLKALAGADTSTTAEVRERVAAAEGLTPEALHEVLPSGKATKFANRVGWAIVHLGKAGLVKKVGHGLYQLTAAGTQLLADPPARIDLKFLNNTYPAHATWNQTPLSKPDPASTGADDETPEEALDRAATQMRWALEGRPPGTGAVRPSRVSRTRGGGSTDRHGLWRRRRRARPGDWAGG